jgi:uncharacterized membrane protein
MAGTLRLPTGSPARTLANRHVLVTDVSIVLFALSLLVRWRDGDYNIAVALLPASLSAAGTVAVFWGAALGAQLTYGQRVGHAAPDSD